MPRSILVALLSSTVLLSIAGTLAVAGNGEDGDPAISAGGIEGRAALVRPSAHLLDRGAVRRPAEAAKGGGPTGPIPIAFPFAGPTAMASGFSAGVGAFGTASSSGAYAGNLFGPGAGYPPGFLTAGSAPGFDITGVFAWHSPFLKTGMFSAMPAGSTKRVLAAAAAASPTTPSALVAVGPASFELATVSTGLPGPAAIVGGPGILTMPMAITPSFPAVFCGLAIGGPGFMSPGWLGNGVGAVIPMVPTPMPPPTRLGFPTATFGTTMGGPFPISAVAFTMTPQTQIAGCYAAGATTPVELQSFHID